MPRATGTKTGLSLAVHDELLQLIRTGNLTPFLFPGAAPLRPYDVANPDELPEEWRYVVAMFAAVHARVKGRAARRFLRSLACQFAGLSADLAVRVLPDEGDGAWSPTKFHDVTPTVREAMGAVLGAPSLIELQAALTEFGVRLHLVFAHELATQNACIRDVSDLSVFVTEIPEDLSESFYRVLDILRDLRDRPSGCIVRYREHQSGECTYLSELAYRRVIRFACECVTDSEWRRVAALAASEDEAGLRTRALRGEHIREIQNLQSILQAEGVVQASRAAMVLRLDAIQFVSDLLWYGFTQWAPLVPSPPELAFIVALWSGHAAPARKTSLAQAAQRADLNGQAPPPLSEPGPLKTFASMLSFRETAARETDPLHLALARATVIASEVRRRAHGRRNVPDARSRGGEGRKSFPPSTPRPPVVFSTCLDRSIERAIVAQGSRVAVIYPILCRPTRGAQDWKIEWICVTRGPSGSGLVPWFSCSGIEKIEDFVRKCETPECPVVIKLLGSPLEELPSRMELREKGIKHEGHDGDDQPRHFVAMSETLLFASALEFAAARTPDFVGEWMRERMKDPSSPLWFVGESFRDASHRVRMFSQVSAAFAPAARGKTKGRRSHSDGEAAIRYSGSAVERVPDPFKEAFPLSLSIRVVTCDPATLAAEIGLAADSVTREIGRTPNA